MPFRPSFNEKLKFPDLTNVQILALAAEAAAQLKWDISSISPKQIRFNVPMETLLNGEEVTFSIEEGSSRTVSVKSQCQMVQFLDFGKNQRNIQRLEETMQSINAFITPEELDKKASGLELNVTAEEQVRLEEQKKRNSPVSFLIPRKRYIATPILMYICILVFLLMAINGADILKPNGITLLDCGANYGPLTLTGDWWRTLTSNFVHIGFIHLLISMFVFVQISAATEYLINTRRLFISFLLTGLCSSALGLYIHPDILTGGVAGSIFGLYGVLLPILLFHPMDKVYQKKGLIGVVCSFIGYSLFLKLSDFQTDFVAYAGGFLSGFVLGIIYTVGAKSNNPEARNTFSIVGELAIFSIFLFSFLALCKEVPPRYKDFRYVWYFPPKIALLPHSETDLPVTSSTQLSPELNHIYIPESEEASWLPYYNSAEKFEMRYLTNWIKMSHPKGLFAESETPLIQLANGDNLITVTITPCITQEEFKEKKNGSSIVKEKSSEESQVNDTVISDLPMTQITNVLHTKNANGTVRNGLQTVLYHYQPEKKSLFTITTIIYDMEAGNDLNLILRTISIRE